MGMKQVIGVFILFLAFVAFIAFISENSSIPSDEYEDTISLSGGTQFDHHFYVEKESDLIFHFKSERRIDVYLLSDSRGINETIALDSKEESYNYGLMENTPYEIRFENTNDNGGTVEFQRTVEEKDPGVQSGGQLFLAIILCILGIVFVRSKSSKPRTMKVFLPRAEQPAAHPIHPPMEPHEFSPPGDQTSISQSQQDQNPSHDHHIEQHDPGHDRSKRKKAPNLESFEFTCPRCRTQIIINHKIKKVMCPKCSHSFKVEQVR